MTAAHFFLSRSTEETREIDVKSCLTKSKKFKTNALRISETLKILITTTLHEVFYQMSDMHVSTVYFCGAQVETTVQVKRHFYKRDM
jgi:hypothetical protein